MDVVERWDRSLRIGDWGGARALLTEDATYTSPEVPEAQAVACATPDQIIGFLRSLKGDLPDVEVVKWEPRGDHVLAQLRLPGFGGDTDSGLTPLGRGAEWFQVLWVRDGLIAKLEDYPSHGSAVAAAG